MPAGSDPVAAHRDGDQIVQAQCHHCGPARRRPTQDHDTILTPLKVPPPMLAPRMEEADTPPGPRIASVGLLALEQIARPAGQPEVVFGIRAPARPRNNMVLGCCVLASVRSMVIAP
jgi:hypothetical protein